MKPREPWARPLLVRLLSLPAGHNLKAGARLCMAPLRRNTFGPVLPLRASGASFLLSGAA
jgi:hypothetical protein